MLDKAFVLKNQGPTQVQHITETTTPGYVNGGDNFVLDESIGHLIRRAHQRASATFMTILADHQFTPTQFFALARLRERGRLSQNRLGRLTAMDPATIQGVTRRLFDRGYIARTPDTTDRRRMVLELTPEGTSVAERLLNGIDTVNGQILAPLGPEEQEQFRSLLKRIV